MAPTRGLSIGVPSISSLAMQMAISLFEPICNCLACFAIFQRSFPEYNCLVKMTKKINEFLDGNEKDHNDYLAQAGTITQAIFLFGFLELLVFLSH